MSRQKGSKNKPKEEIPNIEDVDFESDINAPKKVYMTDEQYNNILQKFTVSLNRDMKDLFDSTNTSGYNPLIGQKELENINTNIYKPTREELTKFLNSPLNNKEYLRRVSHYLESYIMQYKRSLNYFAKIMSYKFEVIPMDNISEIVKNKDDKAAFLKSREKAFKEIEKLHIKTQFPKITDRVISDGVVFYITKTNSEYVSLFELPSEYCYLTGVYDLGYTWTLDLNYFNKYGGLENCVPELIHAYKTYVDMSKLGATGDTLKQYQFHAMQPNEGWVFNFDMSKPDSTPPLKGTFKDALDIPEYKNLLYQRTMLSCIAILMQQIEYDKNNNKFIMEYQQAREIVYGTQSMLPKGVRTMCSPFKADLLTLTQPQAQNQLEDLGESNYFNCVGISKSLLGGDAKSAGVLDYAVECDAGFIDHLYNQYEEFVNHRLRILSTKFRWKIKMFGNRYKDDKRMENYASLVQSKNQPLSKLIAYLGYTPQEYYNIVAYEEMTDIKNKLQPILSGNVMSGKDIDNKGGRHEMDVTELSDEGQATRDNDSNANTNL